MTKIYMEQDGNRYTVRADGHATGSTMVCTAISALLCTLQGWIKNRATLTITERMEPGNAFLQFCSDKAESAFELILVGFLQLEHEHPDCLQVEYQIIS